jgi:PhnB protein
MTGNSTIHPYLTFSGNCREAMLFYKDCLGGKLLFQTIGQSPLSEELPENMKEYIVHSTLSSRYFTLAGSDMVEPAGLLKGNTVSLFLVCNSEKEIKSRYSKLSAGGKQSHPVHHTFLGALFGNLTDKFGNQWLLHFDKKQKK